MKVLFLTKYPPIQGGVSTAAYRGAIDLAAAGHTVHVITNSNEVEAGFRALLWDDDFHHVDNSQSSVGRLTVHQTSELVVNSYIPWTNPYTSKLFGLALEIAEAHGCDVVLASYLEPYGFVAAIIAQTLDVPFIVRHAGSDLGRLSKHQNLSSTYAWILKSATAVLTSPPSSRAYEDLLSLGATKEQMKTLRTPALPKSFSDSGPTLDIAEVVASCTQSDMFAEFNEMTNTLNSKPFDKHRTTIGSYGKVATSKQSFALVEALRDLADEGLPFNFVTLASGTPKLLRKFIDLIKQSEALSERTWILPPIAPWRIPSFIRTCDAICFLEHGFPIEFHMPRVPREVLACGVCLICSSEIALKQAFRRNLVPDKNFVCVDDPTCTTALTASLRSVVSDAVGRHSIARHGFFLSQVVEGSLVDVDPICDLLLEISVEEQKRHP